MHSRMFCVAAVVLVAACQGAEPTRPNGVPLAPPSLLIQDGAHAGNPDFFFLPPMAPNPTGSPGYGDPHNPNLKPTVTICALNATTDAAAPAAACKVGGYSKTNTISGPNNNTTYKYDWTVPVSSDIFYRVEVFVGTVRLGFAEVKTVANTAGLAGIDPNQFTPVVDNKTLSVIFRIEEHALCPGGACSSKTIKLATGGSVTTNIPGTTGQSGVTIPPQGTGPTVTVTAEPCGNLNPAHTDLPTFGPCLRLTSTPPLPVGGLDNAARVFICDITPLLPVGMSHEQTERITLHRFDEPGTMNALPHAPGCSTQVGFVGSLKGFLADMRHGAFKSAGRQLASLVAPRTLYAATAVLDVGAGGLTDGFSDFQFALPASLYIEAGDGQVGLAGSTLPIAPKVVVKDLGGDVVAGARVRFAASILACQGLAAGVGTNSDASGFVTDAPWTIAAGPNTRVACGRGLAGTDFDGPRNTGDPFQPLSTHFGDASNGPEVPVVTGSVTFSATGFAEPINDGLFDFGDDGWSAKQLSEPTAAPAGWYTLGFDPVAAGFSLNNNQAFGSRDPDQAGLCSSLTFGAPWSLGTLAAGGGNDILARKLFNTPTATNARIRVSVDNDLIEVWLNGSLLNPSPLIHEGCAAPGTTEDFTFDVTTASGNNILAIRARDRGSLSYLNVRVYVPSF